MIENIETRTMTELARQCHECVDWVRVKHAPMLIKGYGRPLVVLIEYDEYRRLAEQDQANER